MSYGKLAAAAASDGGVQTDDCGGVFVTFFKAGTLACDPRMLSSKILRNSTRHEHCRNTYVAVVLPRTDATVIAVWATQFAAKN